MSLPFPAQTGAQVVPERAKRLKRRRLARFGVAAAVGLSLLAVGASQAQAHEDRCKPFRGNSSAVTTAGLNPGGSSISATFTVKDGCRVQVSLAAYTMPGPFKYGDWGAYDKQRLFSSSGGSFGGGQHTLTVRIPDCYWQTDLAFGGVKTPPYYGEQLIRATHGGSKSCDKPKPPPTTSPPVTTPPTTTAPPVEEDKPEVGTPTSKQRKPVKRAEPNPDDSIDIDEGSPELGIPSKDAKVPPKWRKKFTG